MGVNDRRGADMKGRGKEGCWKRVVVLAQGLDVGGGSDV
jgi:hypothetical protein